MSEGGSGSSNECIFLFRMLTIVAVARAGNGSAEVLAFCIILQVFDEAKSRDSDHRIEERYDSSRHGSR